MLFSFVEDDKKDKKEWRNGEMLCSYKEKQMVILKLFFLEVKVWVKKMYDIWFHLK